MRVIDCFPFFDEFLILDIRFKELYDYVDNFFIVESAETFTGIPKPFYLSECLQERYPQYADKVVIIKVPAKEFDNAWYREEYQKNHISKENLSTLNLQDNDIILFSDADEIPRREFITSIVNNGFIETGAGLGGKCYYYKLNALTTEWSHKPRVVSYKHFTDFFLCRHNSYLPVYREAGWHFSYIKSPEDIRKKIQAFSHQEFNHEHIIDVDVIKTKVDSLDDLFSRPEMTLTRVEITDDYPEYIKENIDKLGEWIA
jgi:beta-1,4-mannosyl-glycoprotein beta-1,4-N-acetylglucosaminyltransferase